LAISPCRFSYLCWNLTKVEDYYPSGKRFLLRFKEKGGKEKELPVHQKLEEQPGVNARRGVRFFGLAAN
jgi:hypothetical protein